MNILTPPDQPLVYANAAHRRWHSLPDAIREAAVNFIGQQFATRVRKIGYAQYHRIPD